MDGEEFFKQRLPGHSVEVKQTDVTKHLQVQKKEQRSKHLPPTSQVMLSQMSYPGSQMFLRCFAVRLFQEVVRMRGEGMPLRDDPASFGDLHVKAPVQSCQGL